LTETQIPPAAPAATSAPAQPAPTEAPPAGEAAAGTAAARRPGERAASRRAGKREYRGRYQPRRKVCSFCQDKIAVVDYKDVTRLRRYLSERGKIEPRRKTGTCARHQRALATAIKRARHVALLPFTAEHMRITGTVLR
jgi:small subunit ribosomal protein S18